MQQKQVSGLLHRLALRQCFNSAPVSIFQFGVMRDHDDDDYNDGERYTGEPCNCREHQHSGCIPLGKTQDSRLV